MTNEKSTNVDFTFIADTFDAHSTNKHAKSTATLFNITHIPYNIFYLIPYAFYNDTCFENFNQFIDFL